MEEPKVVEKIVHVPQIVEKIVEVPKIVEKIVEVPKEKIVYRDRIVYKEEEEEVSLLCDMWVGVPRASIQTPFDLPMPSNLSASTMFPRHL